LAKWKEKNQHKFEDDNKLSVIFNKAVIKLMDISFTQDNNMSRIKNGLYNYLKTDLKTVVEFEFEFEF
jgi:alpha-amylase/alpha-mannosidase (GH57 family)